MRRQVFHGTLLLVEGESDRRFWSGRVNPTECQAVQRGGIDSVLRDMKEVACASSDPRMRGVLGIIDADWDHLLPEPRPLPALTFRTDHHDLETMMIAGPALDRVLAEHADPTRVEQMERFEDRSLREALLARALPFGQLRWLHRHVRPDVELERKNTSLVGRFLDKEWMLDVAGLHEHAARVGLVDDLNALPLVLAPLSAADPWQVCRGHDLVRVLAQGLDGNLGRSGSPNLGEAGVQAALRLATETEWLRRTRLGEDLLEWERCTPPFRIFPSERA